jgi:hypothetical protein
MKHFLIIYFLVVLFGAVGFGATANTVSPEYVIVDDYAGVSLQDREWYYTRIGSDRGEMGDAFGSYTVDIGGGSASVVVNSGWAGVWTALKHNATANDQLEPTELLGPYIKSQYQPRIVGIEVDITDGSGQFKVELKNKSEEVIAQKIFQLSGGSQTLTYNTTPTRRIAKLNWLVDGKGHATVDEVRFIIESPDYTVLEAVFLFTYGHLCQCYDADTGLVRDRARWPVENFAAVQTIGTFALVTAVAWDLGYVGEYNAKTIIEKTKNTILSLPKHAKGLLPHYLKNGNIVVNTEWSSVDTVITLLAEILACQAANKDTSGLQAMLQAIDWNDLTDNGTQSIGMGYDYDGNKLANTWDTFGSEALLAAVAYSAATGKNDVLLTNYSTPPTWDGSGFNDEMAALFFPMDGIDTWGNNWAVYRRDAYTKQSGYFASHSYDTLGLFGLSACEVPEPWTVQENEVYSAWGVGGHNGEANDGTSLVGYPIIAPHYAAMTAAEYPAAFETLFSYLFETVKVFTPLNNVESFGIDGSGGLHWNSLKGAWNMSLQALGAGRALSGGDYLPYQALDNNSFLEQGFDKIVDRTAPQITLSRDDLYFGGAGSYATASQDVLVGNSGGGLLDWTASSDQSWLQVSPSGGTGPGIITVSVDVSGLAAGSYQGSISIADANASNSPQSVTVHLQVYTGGASDGPFGQFATPLDGSTVSSSVPVTGWALDDVEVESVKIYREDAGNLAYIGDALFVEGARPDVEQSFPDYPYNYRAGWGYMMLTNFLPNGGNGTFTIHAIAVDVEGNAVTLGTKTITVDNANAVKPFGAIDTPAQGGTASGSNFRNHGWVLTPMPNTVPTDGSTIQVYVDGVNLGNAVYNIYRSDIATLFPGYSNSGGAHAYFDIDTTVYSDGVHTIFWTAEDDAGNSDGIGSRYFAIQNSQGRGNPIWLPAQLRLPGLNPVLVDDPGPVQVVKGFNRNAVPVTLYPDDNGNITVEIHELERIEIRLFPAPLHCASLPIGSTLDTERGIFYWQPGPGFVGDYRMVFYAPGNAGDIRIRSILIRILPKF